MIHLINFTIKLSVTIIFIPIIGFCSLLLALIMWDSRFIDNVNKIQKDFIWGKKK